MTLDTFFGIMAITSAIGIFLSVAMSCVEGEGFSSREFEYWGTINRAVRTPVYWVVVILIFIHYGVTTALMTNMGTIAISIGNSDDVALLGIIMAASQVVSRLGIAYFGYIFPGNIVPAGAMLVSAVCNTIIVTIFYFWQTLGSLLVLAIIVGLSYGVVNASVGGFATLIGTEKEDDFATLVALVFPAGPLGTVVFNVISGVLYDREQEPGAYCIGEPCYHVTLAWFAGLSGISSLIGLGVLMVALNQKGSTSLFDTEKLLVA